MVMVRSDVTDTDRVIHAGENKGRRNILQSRCVANLSLC